MTYLTMIISTLLAWAVGLLIDVNIGSNPELLLCLRIVLPVLAVGLCLLREIKKSRESK